MTQIARRDTTVENWLASPATLSQLRAALPSHFAPERMARLALTSLRTVRGLAECTPASIMACVMTASQLGLEPGVLGSCYLIPRKGEATFLIGYQGLLDLIRRSGKVTSIASRVVYETDRFEIDYAASVPFTHKPDLRRKDNRILGFYCHATLVGGEHLFEWMPLHEVNAIRGRSQSGSSGPWATDFSEMGKKTVASRAYVSWFNFKGGQQQRKVGTLSGGERNRVHLAKLLRKGSNLLLLDEPTNDLDVDTLRALEEALLNYAGCAVVISHDRWFLDRIATHILAFEGDSQVVWYEGNYQDYEADRKRRLGAQADQPHRIKYRKLTRG